MANTDYRQIQALSDSFRYLDRCLEMVQKPEGANIEYPLDEEVRNVFHGLIIAEHDDEYKIFEYSTNIKELWGILIKSPL